MGKTVVVYQSKYGATKKYATWIAEQLSCDILEQSKCDVDLLLGFDTIICGGGIYASSIAGFSFIRKNFELLKDKNLIVFAVGASPHEESTVLALKNHNFPSEMAAVPFFYCRGSFDMNALSFGHKLLTNMMKKMVGKKDPSQMGAMEKSLVYGEGPSDWTDQTYLVPLLVAVKK